LLSAQWHEWQDFVHHIRRILAGIFQNQPGPMARTPGTEPADMRSLVLIVALLAGLKVWTQDHLYRSATSAALITAYRDRAAESCFKSVTKTALADLKANPWQRPKLSRIVIGDPDAEVAFWDWQNPLWSVRFRHPHLELSADTPTMPTCRYDISAGVAASLR
jgi:hypothetical protein